MAFVWNCGFFQTSNFKPPISEDHENKADEKTKKEHNPNDGEAEKEQNQVIGICSNGPSRFPSWDKIWKAI